jgi:hypothetical protein
MTALAIGHQPFSGRSARLLILIELFIAANALGGSIFGLAGARGVPREWLEGSPFESYVVPSLILLVAVAGGMTVAASALIVRHRRAAEISIGAGLVLLGWIVVQVLIIPFSWLQPAFFAGGLVVVALGWRLRNGRASKGARRRGKSCLRWEVVNERRADS